MAENKTQIRDFKYRELVVGWKRIATVMIPFNARSDCLRSCAVAFRANFRRIALFAQMPALISLTARRETLFLSNARRKAGEPDLTLDDLVHRGFKPSKVMSEAVTKLVTDYNKTADQAEHFDSLGISYTESMLRHLPEMSDSMDALYSFIVLESWSAFEIFTNELWIAGVDNAPSLVTERLLTAKASIFERADDNIRPETVYKIGINARTNYGSFLKAIGRVSFQKLHKIQSYYEAAFGSAIGDLFKNTEGGYIYALAAFRNVLVHAAAIADREFLHRIERFPEFRNIKEKERILLDGELVRKLSDSAIGLAEALLSKVDDAIAPKSP